jgi:hypothetical protein
MNALYLGEIIIPKALFFFKFAAVAPPVGDTRLLSLFFFLFVFLGLVGMLQIAAAYNRMKALSFFTSPKVGYIFGICVIVGSILIFYLTGNRNVVSPRLEGSQVLGFTFLGLATSVVATLAIANFIKRKQAENVTEKEPPDGMEALQREVYLPLMKRLWRRLKGRAQ